ncbi:dUTP diphosphatase [Rhodohalobacter sp.]|uniref:dUTP diphosphatase n=1 Tax=Rhodohalobacter sp. TaxID=1974210 RepID=UPI0035635F6F
MSAEERIKIFFKKLDHAKNLPLPAYESDEAAGMDIRAALHKPKTLEPGERDLIPTGFQMALPMGYEAQIRPRSGLAYKQGVTMLNTPGTIDSDYRGEVKVLAINHGEEPYVIENGDRIAQMVIAPVYQPQIEETDSLPETNRGRGGFGSTGVK